MTEDVSTEDLFVRMYAVHHRVLVDLESVAAFDEWSPFELLAMRVFELAGHAIGAIDIAKAIGCSFPYASRLSKKLQARGFVSEFRWHQYRALSMTIEGAEWMRAEMHNLTHFTAVLFDDLTPDERNQLFQLLGRVRRSAPRQE